MPRPIALTGGSTELVEGQPKPEPDPIIPGTAAAPSLTTSRLDGWLGSRRPLSPATSATSAASAAQRGNRIRCRRRSRPSLGDTPAAAQFSSPAVPSNEISSPACAVDYWFTDSLRLLQRQRLFFRESPRLGHPTGSADPLRSASRSRARLSSGHPRPGPAGVMQRVPLPAQ